jgi:hypothetical protein
MSAARCALLALVGFDLVLTFVSSPVFLLDATISLCHLAAPERPDVSWMLTVQADALLLYSAALWLHGSAEDRELAVGVVMRTMAQLFVCLITPIVEREQQLSVSAMTDSPKANPFSVVVRRHLPYGVSRTCVICRTSCRRTLKYGSSVELECAHCFHSQCLYDWLQDHHICPTCRAHLPCSN